MQKDTFNFFLYRLNKEYRHDLFSQIKSETQTDNEWLEDYFVQICNKEFDFRKKTRKAIYSWSLRNYQRLDTTFSSVVLARSQLQKSGTIVTDNSLITGESISNPPPADTIILLIHWDRHIVIVENHAGMTTGETWLKNFHNIIDNAKSYINVPIAPRLEPIPIHGTILESFKNLDKIFRFRVRLKLPNPELNRYSKKIFDEMMNENLTEYLQEFISPEGIKKDEDSKAFSSGALAELGYKDGGVQIDGEKNGKFIQIDEGKTAIRGKIAEIRSFVRGLEAMTSGKQILKVLKIIEDEMNRLFPNED